MNPVLSNFDQAAKTYRQHSHVQRRIAERLCQLIFLDCENVKSIWEIGCGTGNLTQLLLDKFSNTQIWGTDGSQQMIDIANAQLDDRRVNLRQLVVDSADDLRTHKLFDLGNTESLDLIASSMALHWVKDSLECVDALANRAPKVALTIPVEGTFANWIAAHNELELRHGVRDFLKEEEIKEWMTTATYESTVEIEDFQLQYETPFEFVKELKLCGVSTPRPDHNPVNLRRIFRAFPQGIDVTYRIAFLLIDNPTLDPN